MSTPASRWTCQAGIHLANAPNRRRRRATLDGAHGEAAFYMDLLLGDRKFWKEMAEFCDCYPPPDAAAEGTRAAPDPLHSVLSEFKWDTDTETGDTGLI